GAIVAVHARVLELDGERAVVADVIQGADDALPVDTAVPGRPEMPAAPRVPVLQMRVQDAALAAKGERRGLDVDVEDAVGVAAQKLDRVDALPVQMARVEGEAELGPAIQRFERHFRAVEIEGDLSRMDLEGEAHPGFGARVEDRVHALGEEL